MNELSFFEKETLISWFLYQMPMDQRHRLMAELPVTYRKLNPEVSADTISDRVHSALRAMDRMSS